MLKFFLVLAFLLISLLFIRIEVVKMDLAILKAEIYQNLVGKHLRKELGFKHGSPYIKFGDKVKEVWVIEKVSPNGIFEKSGVEAGNILIDPSGGTEFYKKLEESRGKKITLTVAEGGDGSALEKRKTRKLTVAIPE